MDDEGNIVTTPMDASTAVRGQGQRVIDVGYVEKCAADVRELVCTLLQSQPIIV